MGNYIDYIKCHLVGSDGKSSQIRRFMIRYNNGNNYGALIEDIRNLFQLFNFTLYYFDIHGEMIIFSTQGELRYALNYIRPGELCVYVVPEGCPRPLHPSQLTENLDKADDNNRSKLHIGVTCESCGGPVHGVSYKCLTCPD